MVSNTTEKPLAGAVKAADAITASILQDFIKSGANGFASGYWMDRRARIIARESGLTELVEAVEKARVTDPGEGSLALLIRRDDWSRIVAAARRVREGESDGSK